MSTFKGCEGIVKVGSTPATVAEVSDWTIDEKAEVVDASAIGTCARVKRVGPTDWSGSLSCHWDPSDTTGQATLNIGDTAELEVYPSGEDTGDTYYSGDAIITGISRSGSFDGLVKASFTFEGTGVLTEAVAA